MVIASLVAVVLNGAFLQFEAKGIPSWAPVKEAKLARRKGSSEAVLEVQFAGAVPRKHAGSLVVEAFFSRSFADPECRTAVLLPVLGGESSTDIVPHTLSEALVWNRGSRKVEKSEFHWNSATRVKLSFPVKATESLTLTDLVVRYRKAGTKLAPLWDQGFQHIVYDKSVKMADEPSFIALAKSK